MIKLEAIIQPSRFEAVKEVLGERKCFGDSTQRLRIV